jgi:asparagine synthase (glutamine-hydrolysing)
MAESMAHRGPDDQRIWTDGICGLAFRRLAIIDLDPRSSQPLELEPIRLIYNGEIYNYRELREELRSLGHRFKTEGDGEVLVHAWREWGESALDRLNGMFALAVWDARRRRLTLASDPFGEKPLYYAERGTRLVFGSDIRAMMKALDRLGAPDDEAVAGFLALSRAPRPDASFFAGVRRLPGSHVLRWETGRVTLKRYWEPRLQTPPEDYPSAVAELRELLLDSVRLRLRSDVPVGTSLSGGIDSSAIVTLSAKLAGDHRRHAFTASFPGFERDEWPFAEAAGRAAGVVEHHSVEPRADELLDDLQTLVRDQEEPFVGTSMYAEWRVFRAAREVGVVVLLDGQGADELFGGYRGLVEEALRARGLRGAARALAFRGPERRWLRQSLDGTRLSRLLRLLRRSHANPYASPEMAAAARSSHLANLLLENSDWPLRRELLNQSFVSMLPPLLRYADRDSMAHSREVRLPFLDRRVAEFAFSLPPEFLFRDGVTKCVLRDAVRGAVPEQILQRSDKVAFEPPQAKWLSSPAWRERIAEVLLDPGALSSDRLDTDAIRKDLAAEHWRDSKAIWRAISVELWLRAFTGASAGFSSR